MHKGDPLSETKLLTEVKSRVALSWKGAQSKGKGIMDNDVPCRAQWSCNVEGGPAAAPLCGNERGR